MENISTKAIIGRVTKRAAELGLSARAVSIASGSGPDLIRDWKRPKAPLPRLDSISAVARVLGMPAGWLAFGEGNKEPTTQEVPIVSLVAAGQFADTGDAIPKSELSYIPVSGLGKGAFIACRVDGDSMDQVAPEGSIIIVNILNKELISRAYYVFRNVDGSTFKKYMASPPRLEPVSSNRNHEAIAITPDLDIVGRVEKVIIDLV